MDYKYHPLNIIVEEEAKQMSDEIITRLIAYRKKLGMTQQDIADATGMQRTNIARIESMKYTVAVESMKKYSKSLGMELLFYVEKPMNEDEKLPLPVGVSSFREASTKYYYIDKTMFIKQLIDENPKVSLFTRPRRFGKTLNMDMLRVFFEKTNEDTSIYFENRRIWQHGERYKQEQGKYPVIFLSFKDIKFMTWEDTIAALRMLFANEFQRHTELFESEECNIFEKEYFRSMSMGKVSDAELAQAIFYLSKMLYNHYKESVVIIIDEYDIPIKQGYLHGYYDKIVSFMRCMFSAAFKDNYYLKYGFLTGILRVAKESIFSGLNNVITNSILEEKYSRYFGFTEDDVLRMAKYYGASDKYDEICEWYDGYQFGDHEIFNPWSVINYFNNNCKPKAFWVATSSNDIISEILENASVDIWEPLQRLLRGESIYAPVDTSVTYQHIKDNLASIYSFLLVTGYLTIAKGYVSVSDEGEEMYKLSIPNKEITLVYKKEILFIFEKAMPFTTVLAIKEALCTQKTEMLQKELNKLLMQSISYSDTANESFYHGLILGLCAMLDANYEITSNRESGDGRYDIQMMPRKNMIPGILIEVKNGKNCSEEDLKKLAQDALEQIDQKRYDNELKRKEIHEVIKYGVAFCDKKVEIISTLTKL